MNTNGNNSIWRTKFVGREEQKKNETLDIQCHMTHKAANPIRSVLFSSVCLALRAIFLAVLITPSALAARAGSRTDEQQSHSRPQHSIFYLQCIVHSVKCILKVGVEESIVNALYGSRITCLNLMFLHEWCVYNRLLNSNF
jgi:hypothetical protein